MRKNPTDKAQAKRVSKSPGQKPSKLKNREFEEHLAKLEAELVKLQFWVKDKGLKVVIVFEGRDAAGKGGVIKRIVERVSPRIFRVVALPAPTEREKSQMYVQRYIPHMPAAGEVVIFDGTTPRASSESWDSAPNRKSNDSSSFVPSGSARLWTRASS